AVARDDRQVDVARHAGDPRTLRPHSGAPSHHMVRRRRSPLEMRGRPQIRGHAGASIRLSATHARRHHHSRGTLVSTTTSRSARRARLAVAALAPAALLLAACANPDVPGAQAPADATHAPLTDAREAVGTWTVGGTADDADAGAVLQIGAGMNLWLDCGLVDVSYLVGTDGALLTDAWSGSGACDLP